MIIKIRPNGRSFAGLAAYLKHDAAAKTADRVAWTHTLNCTSDTVDGAVNEMLWTYRDAELLKEEAGVRPGGSRAEKPVKHFMLSWAKDQDPAREHMIEATVDYLTWLGIQEHQALLFCHTDKEHHHVHVIVNRIHPETGLVLNDAFEYRRTQAWALEYEREQGKIYCEERLKPPEEREASPTRDAWEALKKSEIEFLQGEAQLRNYDPNYMERVENRKIINSEEWKILKEAQRAEREAYFAEGKVEFNELRKAIYREVREEFREHWADYYAAKREGRIRGEELTEIHQEIIADQKMVLDERRNEACGALREERDLEYRGLLDTQKEMRGELIERQEQGLSSPHLLDLVNREIIPEPREQEEVLSRGEEWPSDARNWDENESPLPSVRGVRPGIDVASGLGLGVIGGMGAVAESLFDGFFGWSPTPKQDRLARPDRAPEPKPEFPPHNPFAATADEARRRAERQQEESDRAWWDERRARSRD